MIKSAYFLSFLTITSFISCKKKVVYPTPAPKTVTKDTLSGNIYTIAGNGYTGGTGGGYSGNGGAATSAEIYSPQGVAVDASGNIYISDCQNECIRKVNTNGVISTIAGNGAAGYSGDGGPASSAELCFPYGLAIDHSGNIYISDYNNMRIRIVNPGGVISTFAGNGYGAHAFGGFSGDGGPATNAELSLTYGLAVDGSGNVYIADGGNARIRKVSTNGIISTIAGISFASYSGDGGPATAAELDSPQGVAVDGSGNVYIADYENNRIRIVNTNGIILTFAGNGSGSPMDGGYSGDGGPATAAEIYYPTDVVVDGFGNIYISDAENDRIRMVNPGAVISTFAGTGTFGYSGDGGPATAADIGFVQGIALDDSANIYITDSYFNRIRKVYK